jgi:L-lysine 6-monooxygenase (NADPH-requiring)
VTSATLRRYSAVAGSKLALPSSRSQPDVGKHKIVLAIGAGQANLSLAALTDPLPNVEVTVLEGRPQIRWHPGLQIHNSELQVSFLKDLVTLVDPRSRFSFLSFLKAENRIYRALIANRDYTSRLEFERYIQWVAQNLPDVPTNTEVLAMSLGDAGIWLETSNGRLWGTDIVVGVGRSPRIPDIRGAENIGIDSSSYLSQETDPNYAGRRVAVIGGGLWSVVSDRQGDVSERCRTGVYEPDDAAVRPLVFHRNLRLSILRWLDNHRVWHRLPACAGRSSGDRRVPSSAGSFQQRRKISSDRK